MNIYDFDNTIYDGESVVDFFFFCLKKRPALIKLLPLMVTKLIKYKRCKITIEELESYVEKYAIMLISMIGDVEKEVSLFWDKNMKKVKKYYLEQKRDDDLILSASAGFLLSEFSRRMGGASYICSEIDLKTGKIERVCFRTNKADIFRTYHPDTVIDEFYTDSMNDKPIIDIAEKAFLVKGERITRIK